MDDPQEPIPSLHLFQSVNTFLFQKNWGQFDFKKYWQTDFLYLCFNFLTLIVMTPARQVAETDGVNTWKDWSDCDLNQLYMIVQCSYDCSYDCDPNKVYFWIKIRIKTSQELQMLSSVTVNYQVTKIVMNSASQLSEL